MQFAKHLRDPIKQGQITTTIRVWMSPRVKIGGRYQLEDGYVEVESMQQIEWEDITAEMAVTSGFRGVEDLLKTARHGKGDNVYMITFRYIEDDSYEDT